MKSIQSLMKKSFMAATAALLILFSPAVTFAETNSSPSHSSDNQTSASDASQGPQKPTGPAAKTYHYNETSRLWENDYYTWDPATNQTSPKTPKDYSYNPSTGMWDTTDWQYKPEAKAYVPSTASNPTNPNPSPSHTSQPVIESSKPGVTQTGSNDGVNADNNQVKKSENDATFNSFFNNKISNQVNSTANTGNAQVTQNTDAGNAISGNATDIATLLNMLQSSWNPTNGSAPATFVSNINGNVVGDLNIDPSALSSQSVSGTSVSKTNNNLTVNAQDNGQINNKLNLDASSGNVLVDRNTSAGNAQSGSANAVANVVNVINSAIGSGKSFIGSININGNFNGDILLPTNVINQLLATNSAPSSVNNLTSKTTTNAGLNSSSDQTINNNVSTSAASGNATVDRNTTGGNATTGSAKTNVTMLNLTGRKVVGADSLLVFVNVLGKWVGMIMDAPSGTTAAAIGGGISSNTQTANNADINLGSNQRINNDINVKSKSGDTAVTSNTTAGNAVSGNASSSVNLANITGSQLSLSDWFGILFINVFGSWNGSFGVDTAAGNPPVQASDIATAATNPDNIKVFKFTPTSITSAAGGGQATTKITPITSTLAASAFQDTGTVLAAASNKTSSVSATKPVSSNRSLASRIHNWKVPAVGLMLSSMMLGTNKVFDNRKQRSSIKQPKK
jgi:hypothetical protein